MPGVVVSTGVRSGPQAVTASPSSTYFLVGSAERGPTVYQGGSTTTTAPQLVTSMAEFSTYFGSYSSSNTLWQNAKIFFEEGGSRCYVARVVGASAVNGSIVLNTSGASAAMTITAANPGPWSSSMKAEVVTGTGVFTVNITLNNTLVYSTGAVTDVNAAVAKILAPTSAAKPYITATVTSGSAALVAASATALSSGTADAPTVANLTAALDKFDHSYGTGAVAIPGQTGASAISSLMTHAATYDRVALMAAGSSTDTVSTAKSTAANYATSTGATGTAFYHPHVTMLNDAGVVLTVSPESYVAAKRAVAHSTVGPWQPAAGVISQANFITGLSQNFTKSEGDSLDAGRVNALRVIQGYPRVYGARSASSDEDNYRYLTQKEVMNFIMTQCEQRLEDLVFSPLDARRTIYGLIEARIIAVLEPIRTKGGLFENYGVNGELIDPGYSVVCDDSINPVSQLAQGIVKARVGVRLSSVGDQILVDILKSNLTSPVV
jgi:hypothetical protein